MSKRSVDARQTSKAFQCGPGGGKEGPSISLDEHQIVKGILEKQLKICGYRNDKEVTDLYLGEKVVLDYDKIEVIFETAYGIQDGYGKADANPNHASDEFSSVFSQSFKCMMELNDQYLQPVLEVLTAAELLQSHGHICDLPCWLPTSKVKSGLKDVPHLSRFRKLKNLWLNHNKIQYITFVKNNCCLTELYLHNNDIRNITGALKNLHSLQILLLHNNQLKNLDMTMKELQGLQTLHTLNLFNNPLSQECRYRLYVIYHIPSVILLDRKEITRKERESALHIYNHEKTLVLQSIGFGKRVDIPLLPKAAFGLAPTKVLRLPPGCEFGNHLVKIPFANPEDAVFVRAMKRGMMEFSTVDWGKMPTCEEKRLGSNPEKRPEKLTIRFR